MSRKKSLPVAIVGAGIIRYGERFDLSYDDMIAGAYRNCLNSVDKGIDEKEIEAGWLGTVFGSSIRHESPTGARLGEAISLFPIPYTRVENACGTGADAIRNAAFSIAAGMYDTVLVVGAEKMRDIPSTDTAVAERGVTYHLWWHPRGASPASLFAQMGVAHMHKYGTTREQLAMISVKSHYNGSLNSEAHLQFETTVEQTMNAPMVSYPETLLTCCPVTDGAAALLLTRSDMAHKYTDKPMYILGSALATGPMFDHNKPNYYDYPVVEESSRQAYEMAGVGPKDIDLAELHDCFSSMELLCYEADGFCKKGEAGKWIDERGPMIDGGQTPINTSGGLKSFGHPLGSSGVRQAYEIWLQLRGDVDNEKRRIKNADIGMTQNIGGSASVVTTMIYGREPR